MVIQKTIFKGRAPERAGGLDILKCLCAFLIVCIHCPFPGMFGEYFTALSRIAVPVFFIITGYFYTDIVYKEKELIQIRKIVRLMLVSNILYALWKSSLAVVSGNGVVEYWQSVLSLKNMIKFIFLNVSPFSSHLWYLGAILYVLVIVFFARRLEFERILFIITPFLLSIDLLLGKYSLLIFGKEFPYVIVRNFLFVGLPYFMVGRVLSTYNEKIKSQRTEQIAAIGMVVFFITTLLERFLLEQAGLNTERDHYISTTFFSIAVFLFFLNAFSSLRNNKMEAVAARIGREYSAGIYVIHPIIVTSLSELIKMIGCYDMYIVIAPIAVFVVSVTVIILLIHIDDNLKGKNTN